MKILNTMLGRQAIAAALVLSLAIPMSVGAFAEEPAAAAATDDTVVAGYLPPQEGRVLTLDGPDCAATFRTTIQDMKTLMNQGVSTLVLTTEKGSTTLNLSLLCEGQTDTQRVVLRQLGNSAFLTVGLRCRHDLIVGR